MSETITDDDTTMENLTIAARAEFNGTRVQCFVGIFGGSTVQSNNATLSIQGIWDTFFLFLWSYTLSQAYCHQLLI